MPSRARWSKTHLEHAVYIDEEARRVLSQIIFNAHHTNTRSARAPANLEFRSIVVASGKGGWMDVIK